MTLEYTLHLDMLTYMHQGLKLQESCKGLPILGLVRPHSVLPFLALDPLLGIFFVSP